PVTRFLDINGFTALGLKTGPFVKRDAALPSEYPSPANQDLPFPGPNIIYGITDYPNVFPDPDGIGGPSSFLKGPASGPVELWMTSLEGSSSSFITRSSSPTAL